MFDSCVQYRTLIGSVQKCSACTKNRLKAHGAPIQCTKGKCPKAFHVSCARDCQDGGIVFNVLKEVEKEVVLLDPAIGATPTAPMNQMQVDSSMHAVSPVAMNAELSSSPLSRVIKVIKKLEIQVLCTQHNPVSVKFSYLYAIFVDLSNRRLLRRKGQTNRIRLRMIC